MFGNIKILRLQERCQWNVINTTVDEFYFAEWKSNSGGLKDRFLTFAFSSPNFTAIPSELTTAAAVSKNAHKCFVRAQMIYLSPDINWNFIVDRK